MTLPQTQNRPINTPAVSGNAEAPLQAYVRRLHESRNTNAISGEPVRGIDPWQGIGL